MLFADGTSPSDVQLKTSGFSSNKVKEKMKNASKIWNAGATSSILALLADTDMKIRENGSSLEDTMLTLMIYSIVMKNGLFCAEY